MLAVTAGLLVHGYVEQAGAGAGQTGPQATVVVVARPVLRGERLQAGDLRLHRVPVAYAPPRSFARIEQAAGRVALTDLLLGEVVTDTRLARVRAGPVASLVPPGLRAFAVPTSLPTGTVVAGDLIDVLATFGTGGAGQPHTESVVEGVEVLLVLGGTAGGGPDSGPALDAAGAGASSPVTLLVLVSPDQEERLAFARAFADLEVAIDAAEPSHP